MSSLPFTQSPTDPTLKDVLDQLQKNIFLSLNCHHVGTVKSFDPVKQVATVTINYKKTYYQPNAITKIYDPIAVDYPILTDCPVICLGGGLASLTFPIQPGDECIVLFNDRDMDNWYSGGGSNSTVATPRLHSFADAIVLVGLRSQATKLEAYDSERAALKNGEAKVALGESLITVENADQNLKELLQNLVSDVKDLISALTTNAATFIAVTGAPGGPSPINPAIVTALTNVNNSLTSLSSEIGELLE